jgi:hypothetical protein
VKQTAAGKAGQQAAFACFVFPRTDTTSLCFLLLSAELKLFSSISGLLLESGSGGIFVVAL